MNPLPPPDSLAPLLAATIARLAPGGDRELLRRTALLVATDHDQGHVCTSLAEHAQRAPEPGSPPFPPLAAWRAELLRTGAVRPADVAGAAPLVLDGVDRLYLLRHWTSEQRIVAFLRERLSRGPVLDAEALRASLRALGLLGSAAEPPAEPGAEPDWQLAAIVAAAQRPFAVLTGGPGTGKTTAVARLIAVLLHHDPTLRIALAAPTGKAAARLGEAIAQRAAGDPRLAAATRGLQCKTLHRLLRYLPLDDAFLVGRERPLPHDFVVVDEASMVDPDLLAALCDALRPDARLLLVGDRDQLAAVTAGQVLGDLCRAAQPELGVDRALAAAVEAATGQVLPVQRSAGPLAGCVVALRTSHRFGSLPGIGAFAAAMARRDAAAAAAALAAGHADLVPTTDPDAALALVADRLVAAAQAPSVEQALERFAAVRILCASRHGRHGALAWTERVEELLARAGVRTGDPWYQGRPVLITQNDHQNELWNGDLGVIWRGTDGSPFVALPTAGAPRRVPVIRLPAHETAWAMTVHKAQGSEFDAVLLSMPDEPSPLWQAPLLYTGITRARKSAVLLANPSLLEPALANWPIRSSGLADALAGAASSSAGGASTER